MQSGTVGAYRRGTSASCKTPHNGRESSASEVPGMRWLRVFLLGLTSIYPIYWTAQFALFFLPASLRSLFLQTPLIVVDISYLQATAITGKPNALPIGFEPLVAALVITLAIWFLRGD